MPPKTLPDIDLRFVERIVKGVRRYTPWNHPFLSKDRTTRYSIYCWSDYDGYPFTDFSELRCFPTAADYCDEKLWSIAISYSGTYGDTFDYIKETRKDNSTAHKSRPRGQKENTRFKIDDNYGVTITPSKDGISHQQLAAHLIALNEQLNELDQQTSDLQHWAASGLNMIVHCQSLFCQKSAIPNSRLVKYANQGFSLERLRNLLTCSQCGAKNPATTPDQRCPSP